MPLKSTKHGTISGRFYEDGASFSASLDDPAVTQADMEEEYGLLRRMGFNEAMLAAMVSRDGPGWTGL